MWMRFTENFNWVQPGFTIAYKAGMIQNVTRECATTQRGVAVRTAAPKRESNEVNDDR